MKDLDFEGQKHFVNTSSVFDKLDWLNLEFMTSYEGLMTKEGSGALAKLGTDHRESMLLLKELVGYVFGLESELDQILKRL